MLGQGLEYDEKTDIYSFGMMLYELVAMEEPFRGEFSDLKDLIDAVVKQNRRPKLPPTCPVRLAKLIKYALIYNSQAQSAAPAINNFSLLLDHVGKLFLQSDHHLQKCYHLKYSSKSL